MSSGGFDINRPPNPVLITPAQEVKFLAEAEYFRAQTHGQEIDNRTAEALATSAEIALGREQLKDRWDGASNGRHRLYNFTDQVGVSSVESALDVLSRWQRIDQDNNNPWRFVICSGGGNVVFGMKLYSMLISLARTRPIITIASGICASMATVIHQAGSTRLIEPGTSYMIHDVSGEAEGKLSEIQDTLGYMQLINTKMHEILASKSGHTVAEIAAMAERRDSWLMAEEAVVQGFADAVGYGNE